MTTLVDLFRTLEKRRGEFLVYDDGYRVRRYTYAEVTRAARGFAAKLIAQWCIERRQGSSYGARTVRNGSHVTGASSSPARSRCRSTTDRRGILPIAFAESLKLGSSSSGDDVDPGSIAVWKLADLDWSADGPVPAITISRDDIAQIVFTSGATADPKGVVIRHRNILANTVPVAKEIDKYKKYARPFSPIRFLNLLPLSHMFGQSMATNIPPLIDGTVVFMRSFNPHDIVRRVREWRISVIVCVPKILDVLKEHALRVDPSAADPPRGLSIPARWWRYRKIHRMFGMKFWAFIVGAAPLGPGARGLLEAARVCRDPGLRAHGNRADRHDESPVQDEHGFGRETDRRGRGEDRGRRRDSGSRRERHVRLLRARREPGAGMAESSQASGRTSDDGRVAAHRRHWREGCRRAPVHSRPQEGNDRHAGGAECLSGRRGAAAERTERRDRISSRRYQGRGRKLRGTSARGVAP